MVKFRCLHGPGDLQARAGLIFPEWQQAGPGQASTRMGRAEKSGPMQTPSKGSATVIGGA